RVGRDADGERAVCRVGSRPVLCHVPEARHQPVVRGGREAYDVLEDAVDAIADAPALPPRLDVDLGCTVADRLLEDDIGEAHHRRVLELEAGEASAAVRSDDLEVALGHLGNQDRKSTRLNSSHVKISYA